jgi:hypothetical protein
MQFVFPQDSFLKSLTNQRFIFFLGMAHHLREKDGIIWIIWRCVGMTTEAAPRVEGAFGGVN